MELLPKRMDGETKINMKDLSEKLGVSRVTVNSWCARGAYGAVLDSYLIGGIRYTTEEAFERFVEEGKCIYSSATRRAVRITVRLGCKQKGLLRRLS